MSEKGMTKIEILIVILIAIIIIIGDVIVISYLNTKTQDIQVLSEVKQIRDSLEIFLLNNDFYPVAESPTMLNDVYAGTEKLCLSGFSKMADSCAKNILVPIPNQYYVQGNRYFYKSTENNKNYQLEFTLKSNFPKQGLVKGKNCATNSGITSQPCF